MTDETQLHLRWHSHSTTFIDMLNELHGGRSFTDVSLVCSEGIVRAHKAVLSLSSPYLASVLSNYKGNDEVPILLPEVPVQDLRYIISFIYRGQVDVPQSQIGSFLNTGKLLQILGLEQGDQLVDEKSDENMSPSSSTENNENSAKDLTNNNYKTDIRPDLDVNITPVQKITGTDTATLPLKMNFEPNIKLENIKVENDVIDSNKIDLNLVLQQAIQSASMPCPLCQKQFKSQSGLRDHIRLHTGERPFVCDFCHMNFARASHLKRHRRMHTGEKPFECNVCGKDFSRGDKLKDHIRRHDAENKLNLIRKQFLSLDDMPNDDNKLSMVPRPLTQTDNENKLSMVPRNHIPTDNNDNKISMVGRGFFNPNLLNSSDVNHLGNNVMNNINNGIFNFANHNNGLGLNTSLANGLGINTSLPSFNGLPASIANHSQLLLSKIPFPTNMPTNTNVQSQTSQENFEHTAKKLCSTITKIEKPTNALNSTDANQNQRQNTQNSVNVTQNSANVTQNGQNSNAQNEGTQNLSRITSIGECIVRPIN